MSITTLAEVQRLCTLVCKVGIGCTEDEHLLYQSIMKEIDEKYGPLSVKLATWEEGSTTIWGNDPCTYVMVKDIGSMEETLYKVIRPEITGFPTMPVEEAAASLLKRRPDQPVPAPPKTLTIICYEIPGDSTEHFEEVHQMVHVPSSRLLLEDPTGTGKDLLLFFDMASQCIPHVRKDGGVTYYLTCNGSQWVEPSNTEPF